MALTTKQVWQAVGTNQSDDPISGDLLELDLAAQSVQDNGSDGKRD